MLFGHISFTKLPTDLSQNRAKKQDTRSDSEEESDDDIESDSEDIKDITNNEAQDIVNSKIIGSNHDATKED